MIQKIPQETDLKINESLDFMILNLGSALKETNFTSPPEILLKSLDTWRALINERRLRQSQGLYDKMKKPSV